MESLKVEYYCIDFIEIEARKLAAPRIFITLYSSLDDGSASYFSSLTLAC